MTYWLTISLIVSLAIFVPGIDADLERLNVGADTKTKSLTEAETSKGSPSTYDRLTKRASFMPSRGKKEQFDSPEYSPEKRASFMPSRGKKEQFDIIEDSPEKRASFMPSRGKKEQFDSPEDSPEKRASFMPSRGKKEQFDSPDDSPDKRASAAFMPMRGRKDYPTQAQGWYVGAPQYDYQNGIDDKRAGFMPMRGRKNSAYDPSMTAPSSYFYNDVYPLELNDMKRMSSFMPMRGRKDENSYDQLYGQPSYAVPQPYSQSIQNIDNTNWMEGQNSLKGSRGGPAASIYSGPELEKKNAFFGARGKRSAQNDGLIASNSVQKRSIGGQLDNDHHKYNENFFATRG